MDKRRSAYVLVAGLLALTLVRFWVAAVTPLAPDEAYYWVWSRALAPGYLDHPPMVALWIRAGTALLGQTPLGVRFLGPISAALGSLLLHDTAERLFPGRRAGITAALLLNATLALSAGAVIMTPDTPLLFFWTATLWAVARLAAGGVAMWWLAAGLFAGLGLLSKYTAAFLPLGLALFAWRALPKPSKGVLFWLGGIGAGLLFLPVVLWNADHEWAGFLRQGGRVADWRPARAAGFLAELLAGQAGLATPGVFVLFAAGIWVAARMAMRSRDRSWTLLAALSVPPVLVFVQHAIGDRVQGNWPVIIYPAAAVAAAGLTGTAWRRMVWPSAGFGLALTVLVYAHAATEWPILAGGRDPVARQFAGWDALANEIEAARREHAAAFVAAEPYAVAAELAWTMPAGSKVAGAGSHWRTFALSRADVSRQPVLLVRPGRYDGDPDPADWRDPVRVGTIARRNGSLEIERYALFLALPADASSNQLPVRR